MTERLKTNQNSTGWTPSNLSSIVRPSTGTFPPYIDKDVKNERVRSNRHFWWDMIHLKHFYFPVLERVASDGYQHVYWFKKSAMMSDVIYLEWNAIQVFSYFIPSSLKLPLFIITIENNLFVPLKHYRKSSITPPPLPWGGLIWEGGLIGKPGLFNLANTMVSVHNKELECKVEKHKYKVMQSRMKTKSKPPAGE